MPYLKPAIETLHGTHTVDDVLDHIERQLMFFWPMPNSVAVTYFVEYPRLASCNVFLAGGKMDEILAWQLLVEEWARIHGCDRIEAYGRNWSRAVKGTIAFTKTIRDLGDGWRR